MELNDNHHQNILNYLKFSKFRRAQKLRAVDGNFETILASRVSADETYTGDEIIEILEVRRRIIGFGVNYVLMKLPSMLIIS